MIGGHAKQNPLIALRPWSRHSLVLVVAGLVYIFIGIAFAIVGNTPERQLALSVALQWLPMEGWGFVFIGVGCVSIISARWPAMFKETYGYSILSGLSAAWAAVYFLGIVLADAPWANLSAVLLWGLVAFMWWAISGLFSPDRAVVIGGRG